MKKIEKLSESDIWKKVLYSAFCVWSFKEEWIIKSFENDTKTAWVVYKFNNNRGNYKNYTWFPTNYCDLTFNK